MKIETLDPGFSNTGLDSPTYKPEPQPSTITLFLQPEVLDAIVEITGRENLYKAIGYLATWGGFQTVSIYSDGKADLIAVYSQDGVRGYTIGAIWDGIRYGFHS